VLELLGEGKGKGIGSIRSCDARTSSGCKEDLDCLHLALSTRYVRQSGHEHVQREGHGRFNFTLSTRCHEGSRAIRISQVDPSINSFMELGAVFGAMTASVELEALLAYVARLS